MIRIGIGGWTYEPWRGRFYPQGLVQKKELEFASRAVTAIEINGTYYGRQKPESFAAWARTAPDGRSEEHTSELPSLMRKAYAVFCLKKKKHKSTQQHQSHRQNTH